jgi:membrane-bound ClpP family serine protease
MNILSKKLLLIFFLTSFFLVDDVLFYFLFQNAFRWRVRPLFFAVGATVVVGLNLGLALAIWRTLRRPPTTGQAGMLGKVGVVVKKVRRGIWVRVNGEIWKAETADRVKSGEEVIVEDIRGLVLVVRKTPARLPSS